MRIWKALDDKKEMIMRHASSRFFITSRACGRPLICKKRFEAALKVVCRDTFLQQCWIISALCHLCTMYASDRHRYGAALNTSYSKANHISLTCLYIAHIHSLTTSYYTLSDEIQFPPPPSPPLAHLLDFSNMCLSSVMLHRIQEKF